MVEDDEVYWFADKRNIEDLIEFLMSVELLDNEDDIADIAENPEDYDDVWHLYNIHMKGNVNDLTISQESDVKDKFPLFAKYFQ